MDSVHQQPPSWLVLVPGGSAESWDDTKSCQSDFLNFPNNCVFLGVLMLQGNAKALLGTKRLSGRVPGRTHVTICHLLTGHTVGKGKIEPSKCHDKARGSTKPHWGRTCFQQPKVYLWPSGQCYTPSREIKATSTCNLMTIIALHTCAHLGQQELPGLWKTELGSLFKVGETEAGERGSLTCPGSHRGWTGTKGPWVVFMSSPSRVLMSVVCPVSYSPVLDSARLLPWRLTAISIVTSNGLSKDSSPSAVSRAHPVLLSTLSTRPPSHPFSLLPTVPAPLNISRGSGWGPEPWTQSWALLPAGWAIVHRLLIHPSPTFPFHTLVRTMVLTCPECPVAKQGLFCH